MTITVVDVCAHGVYVCNIIVDVVLDIHGVNAMWQSTLTFTV